MKTSYGKLALLAFILLLCAMLLLPMHIGQEDSLILKPGRLRMATGDRYALVCALSSEDPDQTLSFESSDERIATVDPDGTITALSSGDARITARASGGSKATMRVNVSGVPMESISLNVDELHLRKGEYSGLRVSFNKDASDQRLQWFSSDERVATVNDAGRVLAISGGETYISVLSATGLGASCKVCVDVTGEAVRLSPREVTLGAGAELTLNVSFLPLDATDGVRSFITSDPAVLTVSEEGVVTAKGAGHANVHILTQDGLRDSISIDVDPAPRELRLEPSRATVERGDVLPLQLMFLDADGSVRRGTNHPVTYLCDRPDVASVDENGVVTALKSGTCRVTAQTDGRQTSCDIVVRVSTRTLELNAHEVYLLRDKTGKKIRLQAKVTPEDADEPTVFFESSNTQVATVSPKGIVTMTGAYGTAVIRAYTVDGAEDSFTLNVVTEIPKPTAEIPEATAEPVATAVPVYTPDDSEDDEVYPVENEPYDYEGEGYYDESTTGMLGDFDIEYDESIDEDFYANAANNG